MNLHYERISLGRNQRPRQQVQLHLCRRFGCSSHMNTKTNRSCFGVFAGICQVVDNRAEKLQVIRYYCWGDTLVLLYEEGDFLGVGADHSFDAVHKLVYIH